MDTSDLQDHEIKEIGEIVGALSRKWAHKPNNQRNLEEMCREAEGNCLKRGFIIKMHLTDLLVGGRVVLEVIGKIDSHEEKYGFDHERKRHDVLKSKVRGEDFAGQKERSDSRKPKA